MSNNLNNTTYNAAGSDDCTSLPDDLNLKAASTEEKTLSNDVQDERTKLEPEGECDESTRLIIDDTPKPAAEKRAEQRSEESAIDDSDRSSGKLVAGAIGGVFLGSAAAFFASRASAKSTPDAAKEEAAKETEEEKGSWFNAANEGGDVKEDPNNQTVTNGEENSAEVPGVDTDADYILDSDIKLATNVNDDMSFNEAFAAARSEVGAGGVFEWRGQVYGTYYGDEWNAMTDEEKDDFGKNLAFAGADSSYEAEAEAEADEAVEILGVNEDDGVELIDYMGADDEEVVFIDVHTDDMSDVYEDNNSYDLVATEDDYSMDDDGYEDEGDFMA